MATDRKSYIGSGLVFPLVIDSEGGVRPETGKALIDSSLRTILATPQGLRYFKGKFNSRLYELIEEPNDSVVLGLLGTFIREAIEKWETRIDINSIDFDQRDKAIIVIISYSVLATKTEDTFVFPFYSQLIY
tara:strand:+ start:1616 stop:2011 length:396 start_codon:yes stop_codon:yes gene_type:complete